MISDLVKTWTKDAGVELVNNGSDSESLCEISPMVSYAGEGLNGHPGQHKLDCPFAVTGLYEKPHEKKIDNDASMSCGFCGCFCLK